MHCLAARRARRRRFDLPAHSVAEQHVAHDFARLEFDVAHLQRRADHRWLNLAEEEHDLAVKAVGHDPLPLLPLAGNARATLFVDTQGLRQGRHCNRRENKSGAECCAPEFEKIHERDPPGTHSCAVQSKSLR